MLIGLDYDPVGPGRSIARSWNQASFCPAIIRPIMREAM
jgi:hypothetical protein